MTHADNGRFARTIVNRLWHRLMGRGLVHPVDAMQSEPWNADLLDFLAVDLADRQYDLKRTLRLIASSSAYQSQSQVVEHGTDAAGYVYAGPRAKRLTAEQFVDALWQLTGAATARYNAPCCAASRIRRWPPANHCPDAGSGINVTARSRPPAKRWRYASAGSRLPCRRWPWE